MTMTRITLTAITAVAGVALPLQAFADRIDNAIQLLGELSNFQTDPNAPIGGLLDQHARWHHVGIPGGRTIAPGNQGSGTQFLRFHRDFVHRVYQAAGGQLVQDFNRVSPWTRVPDELRSQRFYPASAEARLLNNEPAFTTEDEFGMFLESQLHNWIHGAAGSAFHDTEINDAHLSPRSEYFYRIHGLVNYLWKLYFPQNCQAASDNYGIVVGQTWGIAPLRVRQWWIDNGCGTQPSNGNTCQKASELFNVQANVTWGAADQAVKDFWIGNTCNTTPITPRNTCQSISNNHGTWAFEAWGSAPGDVRSVWSSEGCNHVPERCQRESDAFGIVAGVTWGSALGDVQAYWIANGCNTTPRWAF